MRRDQLEHTIRTACQIIGADAVIVVGSQAILGSVDEGLLPPEATMSLEVDILPIALQNPNTAASGGTPRFTGWCLERHDRCVALREKDAKFLASLFVNGLMDPRVIAARLARVARCTPSPRRARQVLEGRGSG